jgi:hypothetical protein
MTLREGGLRKRGYLKSPVRENRTPGSVGGQPGNWLSYPDGETLAALASRLTGREIIERLGQKGGGTLPTWGSSRRNVASA